MIDNDRKAMVDLSLPTRCAGAPKLVLPYLDANSQETFKWLIV